MHIRHLIRSDDNALLLGEDSRFVDSDSSDHKNLKLRTMPCAIKLIYNVISKFFTDQSLFVLLQNDVNSFLVHPLTRLLPC